MTLGRVGLTGRGFPIVLFEDHNGAKSSVQASSAFDGESDVGCSYLWIGPDDASPQVMCSAAESVGVQRTGENGWQDYPIPDAVNLTTRMHLSREQVQGLIVRLQAWLDTGDFTCH